MDQVTINMLKGQREELVKKVDEIKNQMKLGKPSSRLAIKLGLVEKDLEKVENRLKSHGVEIDPPGRKWISEEEAERMVEEATKGMYQK